MLNEVKIEKGQTLADMAIQETGWFEGIFDIADTNECGITDEIPAETLINIDDEKTFKNQLRLIKLENIKPATLFGPWKYEDIDEPVLGGIGYMAVGINFIVS